MNPPVNIGDGPRPVSELSGYSRRMSVRSFLKLFTDTWRAFLFILGAWLLASIGLFVAWLLSPDSLPDDDQCAGLGIGCVLTPKVNILFMALTFGVPATTVWFCAGAIATTLLGGFNNLKWWWIGLLSLGTCLLVVAVTLRTVE